MRRAGVEGLFGQGTIVSGGMSLDSLVASLAGLAGRHINRITGPTGYYALTPSYSLHASRAHRRMHRIEVTRPKSSRRYRSSSG